MCIYVVCVSDSGGCGFGLVWLVLVWSVVWFWFGWLVWCGFGLVGFGFGVVWFQLNQKDSWIYSGI